MQLVRWDQWVVLQLVEQWAVRMLRRNWRKVDHAQSYRSGGTENVHWKYTNDPNDHACMNDWAYYAEDGTTLIAEIRGRTTLIADPRYWCALPVYRSGGVEDRQWKYCLC
jgi:hypothetical protein